MPLKNKVQLITYPDSMGSNLLELHYVLRRYLAKAIGGVHILPFYPSSADRGFAPLTYDEVDPKFGVWDDVERIGADFDLIIDFMVNHISRQSVFFQDYLEKGEASEFADMFLTYKKLSPDGEISDADLAKVYTRKPRPPYTVIHRPDGSREKIWCTFDYEQIDLDYKARKTREVMRNFLIRLARSSAKMIRLDAFAYTTVKLGTNCFFLEPEVWELLKWLTGFASAFDTEVLPEIHEHSSFQLKLAEKNYWAYDFSLPMLVLDALYRHRNERLVDWLNICPRKQITTLDTHDGIGVTDVEDLMRQTDIDQTITELYKEGSNVKQIYSGPDYQNLDIYQINCTYYSALKCNDEAYLTARAIQFFAPGIPQVYYVGLLAGENDIELVETTQLGRNINRHNFDLDQVHEAFQKPVVRRLLGLMTFRSTHPAFDGDFAILPSQNHELILSRNHQGCRATAHIDLSAYRTRIVYDDPQTGKAVEYIV